MKTINKEYVLLRETSRSYYSTRHDGLVAEPSGWEATADGPLNTGERITLTRYGNTAQNAYRLLEMALAEQDWKVA